MNKISLFVLCCFVSFLANSQNIEKPVKFQDSLFSVSLFKTIKISENLSFNPGLTIRQKTVFNTFETPLFLNYQSSDKASYFFGISSRTVINRTEFGLKVPYIQEPSRIFISAGKKLNFENGANANFSINFPLEMNLGFKF
jgi:hypothetical protein